MRHMTALAAFYFHAGVFENKRSAFIHMALEARLFIVEGGLQHGGTATGAAGDEALGGTRSVRIVAVRTLHETFVDAVLRRHRKLGALGGMAGIAELSLLFREQELRCRGLVDGMAGIAGDIRFRVRGAANIGAGNIL